MGDMKNTQFVLWLMGPTSSGKSTIAEAFVRRVRNNGTRIIHYDGDEVRDILGSGHGFSESERLHVVKTLTHLANKSYNAGVNVVVSALTAHQDAREYIQENVKNMIIGYIECPIEICAERDPKGLYKKARRGKIDTLIGFNTQYIPPENPDIILNTGTHSVDTLLDMLEAFLMKRGYCR